MSVNTLNTKEKVSISPDRIVKEAAGDEIRRQVLSVFELIEADVYLEKTKGALAGSLETDSPYWDICCALAAYAKLAAPERYLEIGVRRGRSACVVVAMQPKVDLYLFDMWATNYGGVPNPGPDFVRAELAKIGHRGNVVFVSGRSQETVPAFLADPTAPEQFPLMTVDGDHETRGALADLNNVIHKLAPEGMLVFDDICHPDCPDLGRAWRDWAGRQQGVVIRENRRDSTGTGLAFRT